MTYFLMCVFIYIFKHLLKNVLVIDFFNTCDMKIN